MAIDYTFNIPGVGATDSASFWSPERLSNWAKQKVGPTGPAYQPQQVGGRGLGQFGGGGSAVIPFPQSGPVAQNITSGPASGLATALKSQASQAGEQAAARTMRQQSPQGPERRPQNPAAPKAAGTGAPASMAPVNTLTKMTRGAY